MDGIIILLIVIVFIGWLVVYLPRYIYAQVIDFIENHYIKQSDLLVKANLLESEIRRQCNEETISALKQSYTNLRDFYMAELPGLKERIERNNRKMDYVYNVLPYKKSRGRRRYR